MVRCPRDRRKQSAKLYCESNTTGLNPVLTSNQFWQTYIILTLETKYNLEFQWLGGQTGKVV